MAVGGVSPVGNDDKISHSMTTGASNLPEDPDTFRLMIEQMTSSNLDKLFSLSRSVDDSSGESDIFGGGSSFSGMGDPFSSFMPAGQNLGGFDPSLTASNGMDQYKMDATLKKLSYYTDVTETLRWRNAMISYEDSATGLAKQGQVKEVYIQNVSEPQFILESGDKVNFSEVKSVMGSSLTANSGQPDQKESEA